MAGAQREYFDQEENGQVPEEKREAEPDAAPYLSEFEQQRALQKPMTLITASKVIQPLMKRKQPLSLPIPPLVEDIVPLVGSAQVEEESSDADDEHVVQDEASAPPQANSGSESERKRSYLDDVPIQMKRVASANSRRAWSRRTLTAPTS